MHFFENLANFTELDGDGVRDDLDCAPDDATAFALPGEVGNLTFRSPTVLSFSPVAASAGTGTVYDVLQTPLDGLPVGSGFGEACLEVGTTLPSLPVHDIPDAGAGVGYLVRGANACGVGSFGATSAGDERTTAACP